MGTTHIILTLPMGTRDGFLHKTRNMSKIEVIKGVSKNLFYKTGGKKAKQDVSGPGISPNAQQKSSQWKVRRPLSK